ncbi:histidine kinase, partial [Candidatus Bathyarchaeota archaeon]
MMAGKPSVMLIASTPVVSITPDSSVCDAMKLMVSRGFRRLPVVDRGTGRLVGIITATDIVRYAAGKRGELAEAMRRPVSEVMVREVISVRTSSGLEEAIRTMVEHGVGGLPVVDEEGRLWAIVTE